MDYVQLFKEVHALNAKWWANIETGEPEVQRLDVKVALVITELSEAIEGVRKPTLMDDKLPHRKAVEVEMADAVIRLADIAGADRAELSPQLRRGQTDVILVAKAQDGTSIDIKTVTQDWDSNQLASIFTIMKYVMGIEVHRFWSDCAFAIALIEAFCTKYGYDLWAAVDEKNEYNKTRPDHQLENRRQADGKKV
jgi:hypothetical protein